MKLTCVLLPLVLLTAEPAKEVVCVERETGFNLCIEKVDIPSDRVHSFEPVTEAPELSLQQIEWDSTERFFRKHHQPLIDNGPGFLWRILGRHLSGDFGGLAGKINLDVFCGAMYSTLDMKGKATPVTLYFQNVDNVMQPIGGGFDPSAGCCAVPTGR